MAVRQHRGRERGAARAKPGAAAGGPSLPLPPHSAPARTPLSLLRHTRACMHAQTGTGTKARPAGSQARHPPALGKRLISRMTRSKGKGAICSTRISATSPCLPCLARSAANS